MKFEQYDLAVTESHDDAVVYEIDKVIGGFAELSFNSGYNRLAGGLMPLSTLMKPNKKQLENNGML